MKPSDLPVSLSRRNEGKDFRMRKRGGLGQGLAKSQTFPCFTFNRLGVLHFSVGQDQGVNNFSANHAPPSVKTKGSGVIPRIQKGLRGHGARASGTVHCFFQGFRFFQNFPHFFNSLWPKTFQIWNPCFIFESYPLKRVLSRKMNFKKYEKESPGRTLEAGRGRKGDL